MPHHPAIPAPPRLLPGLALLALLAAPFAAVAQQAPAAVPNVPRSPTPLVEAAAAPFTTVVQLVPAAASNVLTPPTLLAEAVAPPADAGPARPVRMSREALSFETGAGQLVTLQAPAANVFVADPKIAEVRPGSSTTLFIFGVGPGHTTVAALDETGAAIAQYDITVRPSVFLSNQVEAALARVLPGSHIRVIPQPKGLLVSGRVDNAEDTARALAVAHGFVGKDDTVEDQLAVSSATQVTLRVRIAEVSRSVTRNLGINWQALGTIGTIGRLPAVSIAANTAAAAACIVAGCQGIGFNGVIDALAQDNLAHVLAEPNLTVMSGQSASFLAGGEFPIPVGQQNGQISITFKRYGVNLSFTPTVLSDGRINLKVSPEVSQLSNVGAVTLTAGNSSIQVPALTVRRAETTIELGSGQSFAIAGLLQNTSVQGDSGLPGLGELPVLGALFRSDKFQRAETELVIMVTPFVARPVDDASRLRLAGENFTPPTDLERIFALRQVGQPAGSRMVSIPAKAGFVVQ